MEGVAAEEGVKTLYDNAVRVGHPANDIEEVTMSLADAMALKATWAPPPPRDKARRDRYDELGVTNAARLDALWDHVVEGKDPPNTGITALEATRQNVKTEIP
jgi:hypothetical protein